MRSMIIYSKVGSDVVLCLFDDIFCQLRIFLFEYANHTSLNVHQKYSCQYVTNII